MLCRPDSCVAVLPDVFAWHDVHVIDAPLFHTGVESEFVPPTGFAFEWQ